MAYRKPVPKEFHEFEVWEVNDGITTFTGQLIHKQQLPPDLKFKNGKAELMMGNQKLLISPFNREAAVIDVVTETKIVKEDVKLVVDKVDAE